MNRAIKTLVLELHKLEIELRIWSNPPNENKRIADEVAKEMEQIDKAISILKSHTS